MFENFREQFILNFIDDNRWQYLTNGLLLTLKISIFSIIIGFIIAVIKYSHDNNGNCKILNFICDIYLTIIRGTPVVVQLLIIYFVIFGSTRIDKSFVAIIAFGINSGAYQAEIFRSGLNSIPRGQYEAGRSLGFSSNQTMVKIIMPQAVKNVIPALCNEFISLIKETSVSGYIALEDLTKGGDIIRSRTYSAFMPLIAVALTYLVLVMILTQIVKHLERNLRKNER